MEIEAVKSREQLKVRATSILMFKLSTAESKEVAGISKELRRWNRIWFIQGFRFRRK